MNVIWKFPAEKTKEFQRLLMPSGAQVLSIQFQGEELFIFALVDPEAKKEGRILQIFATGELVENQGIFLGTFQLHGEAFVFHAFIK